MPSLTVKTKGPVWLTCTALVGTTTASSIRSVISTVTSAPGLARDRGFHHRGLGGDSLTDVGQNVLRHGKADIDRRRLDDGRHRRSVGLAHEIADLHVGHADAAGNRRADRSEEHTSELQSRLHLVCRLLLEKKKTR